MGLRGFDGAPCGATTRGVWIGHVLLLVAGSAAFESLFIRHGLNPIDEGWPLYAAQRLHAGGDLYQDAFFVFPPGHALAAWLAYAIAPPGVVAARAIYAGFTVALCLALYALALRLMSPRLALLAASLVALAAPESHLGHNLFGYRYLVFAVLALLGFDRRLRTENGRWMVLAGAWTGVALYFRVEPAFAVTCGLMVGTLAASSRWRTWLADGAWFTLGFSVAAAPLAAWLTLGPGLGTVWREVVVRAVTMTDLQSLPIPALELPLRWRREAISRLFVAVQFRLYPLLYLAYLAVLVGGWTRTLGRRRPFEHALLLASVVWGGVYFLRALGRSDSHHLYSVLPPACLFLAHLLGASLRAVRRRAPGALRWSGRAELAAGLAALIVWVFLMGSDTYLDPARRGVEPLRALGGRVRMDSRAAHSVDRIVAAIQRTGPPGATLLDLSASPLLHVLSGHPGPGGLDVIMRGTFLDAEEELGFLARLEHAPLAAVLSRLRPVAGSPIPGLERSAPLLARWVAERYEFAGEEAAVREWVLLVARHAER